MGDALLMSLAEQELSPARTHKRKEKIRPFGINLMRSQVSYRAACQIHRLMFEKDYEA